MTEAEVTYRGEYQNSNGGVDRIITITRKVEPDGIPEPLPIKPSMQIYHHSSEFNWGYHGSGPAQTALALLIDVTHDPMESVIRHQDFKREVVAAWPQGGGWEITASAIKDWLAKKQYADFEAEARRNVN